MRNIARFCILRCVFAIFMSCCWILFVYFTIHLRGKQRLEQLSGDDGRCKEAVRFSKPVDVVFTWVNGSDESFIDMMIQYLPADIKFTEVKRKRYREWGTLRYALRSVEKNADWIRHVYIVTNGQIPSWLNTGYHKVSIIKHSEIFQNLSHLPTFNSQAIECHIHRIPGLSKTFIYMNDDIFLTRKVEMEDFYTKETGFKIRFGNNSVEEYNDKCLPLNKNRDTVEKLCEKTDWCEWDGDHCKTDDNVMFNVIERRGAFRGSLLYTAQAYDKEFGHMQRGIPVHAPFIINVEIMNALQDRFPDKWERTSASKFRDAHAFQYGFAYYHFLMANEQNICREDKMKPLATVLNTDYPDYKYIATGNSTTLEKRFNNFLRNSNKSFLCINDSTGMKSTDEDVTRIADAITKFLEEYFPEPSKFEKREV